MRSNALLRSKNCLPHCHLYPLSITLTCESTKSIPAVMSGVPPLNLSCSLFFSALVISLMKFYNSEAQNPFLVDLLIKCLTTVPAMCPQGVGIHISTAEDIESSNQKLL